MKRLSRNEEGVSPVIATILMVAITVVLAGTLWMMVGDFGDDVEDDMVGSISVDAEEDNGDYNITLTLGDVPEVPLEDLDVRLLWDDDNGDRTEYDLHDSGDLDFTETDEWTGLTGDGEVQNGAEFIFDTDDLGETFNGGELVRIDYRADDYDGRLQGEF